MVKVLDALRDGIAALRGVQGHLGPMLEEYQRDQMAVLAIACCTGEGPEPIWTAINRVAAAEPYTFAALAADCLDGVRAGRYRTAAQWAAHRLGEA